jgi:Mrp family chromosome partitioning ATPase
MKALVKSDLDVRFHLLRTRVEKDLEGRAVVLVTSAEAGDGATFTAHMLAHCFARTGRVTTIVDATTDGEDAPAASTPRADAPSYVRLPRERLSSSRRELLAFLGEVRASNEVTIVKTSPILSDPVAMALAGAVDGVLITVAVGRRATNNDAMTKSVIEQSRGRILGVVAATKEAIAEYERRRTTDYAVVPAPQRTADLPAPVPLASRTSYLATGTSISVVALCIAAFVIALASHAI